MILSRLPAIMANHTCIIVAHRLSRARYAKRILVVQDGSIVEVGEHQTLMDAKGLYADMVALDRLHRKK